MHRAHESWGEGDLVTKRKPFDFDRALDEVRCPTCEAGDWTVRVTVEPRGLFSMYACDDCSDMVLAIVCRAYPAAQVGVHPLPNRKPADPAPAQGVLL